MKLRLISLIVALWLVLMPSMAQAQIVPNYTPAIRTFGDYTNWRPCPTSGVLTGTYRTAGNWVQTGPITAIGFRGYFGGTVTFNAAVTVSAGVEGNSAPLQYGSLTGSFAGVKGNGPGGGGPYIFATVANAPGGGGHGAAGGNSNATVDLIQAGGIAYDINNGFLAGSSGGGTGGSGYFSGAGGGSFYVEALGNIVFTSAAAVTATGGAGTTIGGGGSGGGIDVRSLGNITVASGGTITATGGAAAGGGGGGAGGVIQLMPGPGKTSTVAGATITAAGGAGGGGTSTAGGAGTVTTSATFTGSRVGF